MIINNYLDFNNFKKLLKTSNLSYNDDKFLFLLFIIVDNFDKKNQINKEYVGKGRPPYPIKNLLILVIFAYNEGIYSGRKIWKRTLYDLRYRKIMDYKTPCYHVINDFKTNNAELIYEIFKEIILTLKSNDLINFGSFAIDGTKFRAHASKSNILKINDIDFLIETFKQTKLERLVEDLDEAKKNKDEKEIEKNFKKCMNYFYEMFDKISKDSNKLNKIRKGAINFFKRTINNLNKYKQSITELNRLKEILLKSGQKSVSITDPESRWMKNKKEGVDLDYNIQAVIETEHNFILNINATDEPTDIYRLIPEINNVECILEENIKETTILADNGYYNEKNISYLKENGYDALIPNRKQATESKNQNKKIKKYSIYNFQLDLETNTYTCPQGQIIPYKKTYYEDNKSRAVYYTDECLKCKYRKSCTKSKYRYRIISRYTSVSRHEMEVKFENAKEQNTYEKRSRIESVFGNIKQNYGFTQTNSYGLKNMKTEVILFAIVINLKKILKLII